MKYILLIISMLLLALPLHGATIYTRRISTASMKNTGGIERVDTLPLKRLCHNWGNGEKRHAELVSASNRINKLRDPETSSG